MKAHHIRFDLLTNARDSLRQAVQLLAWKDIGADDAVLKHAITNASHAIELLLKERLRRESPALLWENVDKYPSLEARTITADTAISRLKNIAGLTFHESDERNLRALRRTRNAIEHFEWHTTNKEAKTIVGNALSFAFAFASEHLKIDLEEEFKQDDTWRALISEVYDFARAHGARVEARLTGKGVCPMQCEGCGEWTVARDGDCELCGHWTVIETSD